MIAKTKNRLAAFAQSWWPLGGSSAYDAVNPGHKRKVKRRERRSVDQHLRRDSRDALISEARDLQRNFSLAAWAIRQHLDFVASFTFQAKTTNQALNERMEELMSWYSRPLNCDVRGMASLTQMVRMLEERRTSDGDVFLMKLSSGMLQPIEGDRIRDFPPDGTKPDNWVHGVRLSKAGRPQSYAVWKRTASGSFEYERTVRAGNMLSVGYYERFDQVRGVSPLASAAAQYRDLYENLDYALAKAKVAQLFAMIFHTHGEGLGIDEDSQCEPLGNKYDSWDPGKGPAKIELDPGEDAKFLDTRHPSSEFQQFTHEIAGICLKALDIPMSFAYEDFSNFNGQKAALSRYLQSAEQKRLAIQHLLNNITAWRFNLWIADGVLDVPGVNSAADIRWEWLPTGRPWWNPVDEVTAAIMEINGGLGTRSEYIQYYKGRTFRDVIDELADEQAYMASKGVSDARLTRFIADQPELEL